MRGVALAVLAGLCALALWLWGFDGAEQVSAWAAKTQREVQNAMAVSLRALRAGEPGALLTLWSLCFGYGFVHAAGPGHGKLVIGGYGVAARVSAKRLTGLAVLSSLAQALTAILLVYVALWVLGWGRVQMSELADRVMAPTSYALIAAVGLWLLLRGLRKFWRMRPRELDHGHTHVDGVCQSCGHAHAPTPEQAASVSSLRDALAVIGAIAIRPCTGALFLLILTHALGLDWAGIIGALVMGVGTASFTGLVAFAAVGLRESALAQVASTKATVWILLCAEILAGTLITVLALQLLLRSL